MVNMCTTRFNTKDYIISLQCAFMPRVIGTINSCQPLLVFLMHTVCVIWKVRSKYLYIV